MSEIILKRRKDVNPKTKEAEKREAFRRIVLERSPAKWRWLVQKARTNAGRSLT